MRRHNTNIPKRTTKTVQSLFVILFFIVLLSALNGCCPPYCGERYGTDYYCPLEIKTVKSGDGYLAIINGEGFDNLELKVIPSEFVNDCTGTLDVTKNYAALIKKQPQNFNVIIRKNCSMAIVRAN